MTIKTIEDLRQLPEPLLRDVLAYADRLALKADPARRPRLRPWDEVQRITIEGETLSETVIRMRQEERW